MSGTAEGSRPPARRWAIHGWFGYVWGAEVQLEMHASPVPVGESCGGCPHPIADGDQGLIISDAQTGRTGPWHLDCWRAEPPLSCLT